MPEDPRVVSTTYCSTCGAILLSTTWGCNICYGVSCPYCSKVLYRSDVVITISLGLAHKRCFDAVTRELK